MNNSIIHFLWYSSAGIIYLLTGLYVSIRKNILREINKKKLYLKYWHEIDDELKTIRVNAKENSINPILIKLLREIPGCLSLIFSAMTGAKCLASITMSSPAGWEMVIREFYTSPGWHLLLSPELRGGYPENLILAALMNSQPYYINNDIANPVKKGRYLQLFHKTNISLNTEYNSVLCLPILFNPKSNEVGFVQIYAVGSNAFDPSTDVKVAQLLMRYFAETTNLITDLLAPQTTKQS